MAAFDVRAIASAMGYGGGADLRIVCPPDLELIAVPAQGKPRLTCVARDSALRPVAPAALVTAELVRPVESGAQKPAGPDAGGPSSPDFASTIFPAGSTTLELGAWMRAAVGVDGADGAPALCATLARGPALGVVQRGPVTLELLLDLPANDVSLVSHRVIAPGLDAVALERAVAPMIEALRSIGGTASQATARARVRCAWASELPQIVSGDELHPPNEKGLLP